MYIFNFSNQTILSLLFETKRKKLNNTLKVRLMTQWYKQPLGDFGWACELIVPTSVLKCLIRKNNLQK